MLSVGRRSMRQRQVITAGIPTRTSRIPHGGIRAKGGHRQALEAVYDIIVVKTNIITYLLYDTIFDRKGERVGNHVTP
jgi:hypothetical protein